MCNVYGVGVCVCVCVWNGHTERIREVFLRCLGLAILPSLSFFVLGNGKWQCCMPMRQTI